MRNSIKSMISCAMVTVMNVNMFASVAAALEQDINYNELPKMMITEIMPDSDNVNKKDGYEFIEIYNNSNKSINIKDFKLIYKYPTEDNKSDISWDLVEDKIVQSQESFVVWIKNSGNESLTIKDFNEHFGKDIEERRITTINCDGMSNSAERTLAIANDNGEELSLVNYIKEDVNAEKGIDYSFTTSKTMNKVGIQESATPGEVKENQVPKIPVEEDQIPEGPSEGENPDETDKPNDTPSDENIDVSKMSPLLITEIVPDSTNVDGSDGYEFIEIYNNSDKDINFKDYKIRYRYPMDGRDADLVWSSIPEDVVIKSKDTLVFWIINKKNTNKTIDDFNNNYKSNLVENKNIVKIYSDGMANGSNRGLAIATNSGIELTSVYYNDEVGVTDNSPNKGILYKYHNVKGEAQPKISSKKESATPGKVIESQVPSKVVNIKEDTIKPTIDYKFNNESIKQGKDYIISFNARDNIEVKTVELYYKTDKDADFRKEYLKIKTGDQYSYTVYSPELIGSKNLEYYIVVSDGYNELKTETYKKNIEITEKDELRINVKDNQFINGKYILKAVSETFTKDEIKINIDDKKVENTYNSLEEDAYFVFDVNKTNVFFKNAVCINDEILQIMDDTINGYITMTVPIDANKIKDGENLKIDVRAGTKVSPFDEESVENRDDFYIKNAKLILADGTIIKDLNFSNENSEISVGDGSNAQKVVSFNFDINEENFEALATEIDTSTLKDGNHKLSVVTPNSKLEKTVVVDNTAPEISTNLQDNKKYKGEFEITANAIDELSGVESINVTLDDKEIKLPYKTSSAKLSSGEHVFEVVSKDKVGNKSTKKVKFLIGEENPNIKIVNDEKNKKTYITIEDEDKDDVSLDILGGYKYSGKSLDVTSNNVDVEPPKELTPEGETYINDEGYQNISKVDKEYLTTNSLTKFPYHKFKVKLDENMDKNSKVELKWQGKSKSGRKVTMYVWNKEKSIWEKVISKIAGSEDFSLEGVISGEQYIVDNAINVMVQDEISIPQEEQTFTMAWMSDTQYYSESYPHIYENQVNWLAKNKEKLNLKYVFHTGDLVDEVDDKKQWDTADKNMQVLDDANIPYGVLAGNHDVGHKDSNYEEYYKYFGEDRFENEDYYGESYKNNRGHYDLVSAGGNDFIMVYMGWDIGQEEIDWMNEVLAQHKDRTAILNFHEYLLVSGNRSPIGDEIYEKVVIPNENVKAVLCGHYHDSETLIDDIDDDGDGVSDRKVYQMLADYQGGPEGGQGYMRLLSFDTNNNIIDIKTYSPYLDDYNYYDTDQYPGKDEFKAEMDLEAKEKLVATDYFEANVYTDTTIKSFENIKSGEKVTIDWDQVKSNGDITYWYALAKDKFGGVSKSDVYKLTATGTDNPGDNNDSGGNLGKPEGDNNLEGDIVKPGGDNNSNGNNSPQTGEQNILLVSTIGLTAALGVLFIERKNKKRK